MLRFTRILRVVLTMMMIILMMVKKMMKILSSDAVGESFVTKVNGDLHCGR